MNKDTLVSHDPSCCAHTVFTAPPLPWPMASSLKVQDIDSRVSSDLKDQSGDSKGGSLRWRWGQGYCQACVEP